MGTSIAKPSKHQENTNKRVPAVLKQTCEREEAQVSSSDSFRFEPLGDIYTEILTADIRSDFLYTGLNQHYGVGNAITASFNLVPTATNDPAFLFKHRAVIRLAPILNKYQADGGVEYDLRIETSMMMAFKILIKQISRTKFKKSVVIELENTSVTGATTSEGSTSTSSTEASCTSRRAECVFVVKNITSGAEGTQSGMKGTVTQNIDILEKIAQYSSQGGRIMCITVVGSLDQTLASDTDLFDPKLRFNTVSVADVFMEVPRMPLPAMFIYQIVTTLIPYRVKGFRNNQEVSVLFDYAEFFLTHLNQGWKLVGIIQYDTGKNRLNSFWFFEKEKTRIDDSSPVYEGTIVAHKHIYEGATKRVEMIKSDVKPVLQEMGAKGWEIACSLDTPEATRINEITTQIIILLFFQRRIIYP
ncbi:uncharacterized protein LOC116292769 [Actinia tenebrosa]|uniref:Uncharacterized protein LOC116292769 n=1 Tax=Actinia tenebrosa TaxID=6105 RepID=A0A6P8HJG4_ACTTE|nr:uncharacterized protein LOC116292769 [Actinia tenebrosa]